MKIKSLSDVRAIKAYLDRIGAEPRSIRTAVVKEVVGRYWRDVAVVRFRKDGEVFTDIAAYLPTEAEQDAIKQEISNWEWPNHVVKPMSALTLPPELKEADPKNVFHFISEKGDYIMSQLRRESADGEKVYVPFTFWDDDQWRIAEPEGDLPLWGLDRIKGEATVFIHEGAKAARAVVEMLRSENAQEHPWHDALKGCAHVGWIGGAMNPRRTDWKSLKRLGIKRAFIVADNDTYGRAAVPRIAKEIDMLSFHVQFTDEWPVSFDLADEFPESMFAEIEGRRVYVGPSFRSTLQPATWMTDLVQVSKSRSTPVLREHAKDLFRYVEEADLFVCAEMPEILRTESILNKMLASFSDSSETSRLIVKAYRGRTTRLCYRPDIEHFVISDKGSTAINLHVPTTIRSIAGDPSPWLRFLDYMFPNADERDEIARWCATLIARPDIRMEYGLLLVSETQGVGKTTLASNVLAPLVGYNNVSWPSEGDIVNSEFNDWVANRRLIIVNEIYSGHSWKAYNKLKSLITDAEVQVNQKFQRRYTLENFAHIVASSNSMRALRMEEDDRRWLYPEVTEVRWPREQFAMLRAWLAGGGLSIIRHWAEKFDNYVMGGERAPMTSRKRELIEGSRSEGQREAAELASVLAAESKPAAYAMKAVVSAVRNAVQGRVFDSDYELRKAMTDVGVRVFKRRIKIGQRMQYAIINDALAAALERAATENEENEMIRSALINPAGFSESEM